MHLPRSIWVIVAKYDSIIPFNRFSIFTNCYHRFQLPTLLTYYARHVTHDVILLINKMLSKEDRVLIKVLRVEKGHGAKRIITEFPEETSLRLTTRSGAFCKSESTVAGSVTSTIWKNDWLQNNADLTRTSLTELSTSGGSDCVGVSERTEDTFSIKFKRSDYLTWQQLCLLIEFLTGFI